LCSPPGSTGASRHCGLRGPVTVSCLLLQVAAAGAATLVPENAGLASKLLAVFAILLPVFVYTFMSALWMLRTLAEVAFARR
jgi:hypothetical protein